MTERYAYLRETLETMSNADRNTPEWQNAVDRALEESGHGVHRGYDITADGTIVCAWDGEPVAHVRTVADVR